MSRALKVGIVGCGNISGIYFSNLTKLWDWVTVEACSDLMEGRAKAKAEEFGIPKHCSTEELLGDESIDIVLNLTTPELHATMNAQALNAGKHVYVEKPLAVTREDAASTLALADSKGLRVGCAPDTFLGAGGQVCRRIIEDGSIGDVVSAMAFMVCHGHESWHPDPEFYYQRGGGPMLDMGPYYLTQLVNCVGPMTRVVGATGCAFEERVITSEKKNGKRIPVETPTHVTGCVTFANGAIGTVVLSFDVWKSTLPRIEIHGTKGSLVVPDPNSFGGPVRLYRQGDEDWQDVPLEGVPYGENSRGMGLADMALGILEDRPHRAGGSVAGHVLDAMLAFEESSDSGKVVDVTIPCERPAALEAGLKQGRAWK